jgi:hypothetical protein
MAFALKALNTIMKYFHLLICIALFLSASSCCRNVDVTCSNGILNVAVVGNFNTASPIAVRYKQDNAFDIAIDTFAIRYVSSGYDSAMLIVQSYDSSNYALDDSVRGGLMNGYDYKFFFPGDTLTYEITGLNATGSNSMELRHCGDNDPATCYRNVYSCNINGISTAALGFSPQIPAYEQQFVHIYLLK